MKPTPIQFEYDDAKLEAITVCLSDKQTDVTKELEAYMEVLYKKYVPVQVRDFIEKIEVFPEMMRFTMKTGMVTEVAM